MKWLKKLFSTHREFTGSFIETDEALLELIASNQVAAAEYGEFKKRISKLSDNNLIEKEAIRSADALSGYGISVSPMAFLEAIDD
ncbi:hypothetical protein KC851_04220 [Candidatus Kaiserbacteria bacterium]|nr:hypothetical protein [Candidatus Kaiserbacteria bacterium]